MKTDKNQQKPTVSTETGLTTQQEKACIMLAAGATITEVAECLGINRCTLYQWQNNIAFVCYFNRQSQTIKDEVKNGVMGLCQQAVETVRELLSNGNEATKLKAAFWILEKAEAANIGQTDLREAIKAKHTTTGVETNWGYFDEVGYKRELKQIGLSDQ